MTRFVSPGATASKSDLMISVRFSGRGSGGGVILVEVSGCNVGCWFWKFHPNSRHKYQRRLSSCSQNSPFEAPPVAEYAPNPCKTPTPLTGGLIRLCETLISFFLMCLVSVDNYSKLIKLQVCINLSALCPCFLQSAAVPKGHKPLPQRPSFISAATFPFLLQCRTWTTLG